MAPEFVIADAPFVVYPGGVIAIRPTDWMAGARGTLSSGTDLEACSGTFVLDEQVVTQSIFDNESAAYDEALDTLVMDADDLPIEPSEFGFLYDIYMSIKVLGEWETANQDTCIDGSQDIFRDAACIGFHGSDGWTENSAATLTRLPARRDYYVTIGLVDVFIAAGETLHFRAFAQSGTTISIRIDQLVFLPRGDFEQWTGADFEYVEGPYGQNSTLIYPEDGADGGDVYGKFTRTVSALEDSTGSGQWTGTNSGADYQRYNEGGGDAAEYLSRVVLADNEHIENSTTGAESDVHAYGLHGARWKPRRTYTFDEFDRSLPITGIGSPNSWGWTPEGYSWSPHLSSSPSTTGVEGGVGVIRHVDISSAVEVWLQSFTADSTRRADIRASTAASFAGRIRLNAPAAYDDDFFSSTYMEVAVRLGIITSANSVTAEYDMEFVLNRGSTPVQEFRLIHVPSNTVLIPTEDIGAWYADGMWIGWRIEFIRHVIRLRRWDASGAEPTTWDYEDFFLSYPGGSTYPYGDVESTAATTWNRMRTIGIFSNAAFVGSPPLRGADIEVDDVDVGNDVMEVGFDPVADPMDTRVRLERPEGTTFGEITIPFGADYFVYWGQGDFTDASGGLFKLVFSTKHWNLPNGTSSMLQRGETMLWWFRSKRGGIISMNWRSGHRTHQSGRVLLGNR